MAPPHNLAARASRSLGPALPHLPESPWHPESMPRHQAMPACAHANARLALGLMLLLHPSKTRRRKALCIDTTVPTHPPRWTCCCERVGDPRRCLCLDSPLHDLTQLQRVPGQSTSFCLRSRAPPLGSRPKLVQELGLEMLELVLVASACRGPAQMFRWRLKR